MKTLTAYLAVSLFFVQISAARQPAVYAPFPAMKGAADVGPDSGQKDFAWNLGGKIRKFVFLRAVPVSADEPVIMQAGTDKGRQTVDLRAVYEKQFDTIEGRRLNAAVGPVLKCHDGGENCRMEDRYFIFIKNKASGELRGISCGKFGFGTWLSGVDINFSDGSRYKLQHDTTNGPGLNVWIEGEFSRTLEEMGDIALAKASKLTLGDKKFAVIYGKTITQTWERQIQILDRKIIILAPVDLTDPNVFAVYYDEIYKAGPGGTDLVKFLNNHNYDHIFSRYIFRIMGGMLEVFEKANGGAKTTAI